MTSESIDQHSPVSHIGQQNAEQLLSRLATLASKFGEEKPETSRDALAYSALLTAAGVIKYAARWALEHEYGLAERRLGFMPLVTGDVTKLPAYHEKQTQVDDPSNQVRGAALMKEQKDFEPSIARQMLINILRPLRDLFPPGLHAQVLEGLEALEYGDAAPIFSPVREGRKRGYLELKLQLKAVCHVEFRYRKGERKLVALDHVADAFGVDPETVRKWEPRLRKELGEIVVADALSRARHLGSRFRAARKSSADTQDPLREITFSEAEVRYGGPALQRDGANFKKQQGFNA